MTNGEKIKATFPHYDIEIDELKGYVRIFYENFYTTYSWDWWNAEYKEPTTKNDLGVDCIDRAELLKAMDTWDKFGYTETGAFVAMRGHYGDYPYTPYVHYDDIVKCVKGMPSVTPIRPKGHWIDREVYDADRWKCSECGRTEQWKENFCPNCGSDNREVTK